LDPNPDPDPKPRVKDLVPIKSFRSLWIRIHSTVYLYTGTQRWASFPPEVKVKSLPLPTNLKIVTVTSFSLPA
jgi:hypothetical protein